MTLQPVAEREGTDRPTPAQRRPLRLEIQALRALAVAVVVLFHFWPGRMPGGYVGVDVFFVISGFLITGHLLREVDASGRIALARFWARRARRLLPAAYLVIVVTTIATVALVPATLWQQWFREIAGATLYVENWVLSADAVDYLAADNSPSAVQHYWSLSAEEQFYLVWPVLVLLAALVAHRVKRSPRGAVAVALGAATLASFGYSLWLTVENPASAYFVTTTRAWQFGAGALLALWLARQRRGRLVPSAPLRSAVSWAGLLTIVACAFVYDAGTPFPGTAAIPPVLATLAVIWAGSPQGPGAPSPLMAWRPVQYAGEISYSLYLWHWPAIVILPFALGHEPGLLERVALLVAVVLAAAASKRFVEDPARTARRWKLHHTGRVLALTAASGVVLALVAATGWAYAGHRAQEQAGLAERIVADPPPCFGAAAMDRSNPCDNPDLDDLLIPSPEAARDDMSPHPECFTDFTEDDLKDCTFGPVDDAGVPHVVLIGDSHARAMLPAYLDLAEQGKIVLSPKLKTSCAWTTGTINRDDPIRSETCETWKSQLQPWLVEHADQIDLIVTTGYQKILSGDAQQQVDHMRAAWQPLADLGVPIVAVPDNPIHGYNPSDCLAQVDDLQAGSCSVTREEAFPFPDTFTNTAEAVEGAKVMDLTDYYCREKACPSVIGGVNVYRDGSHMTSTYTKTLAPYIYRELRALDALPAPS
ncbi:acyltransferase family protein [Isoptericola hypogeus]|uniref:Acyltransferase family protein n=1 Tax=Isoptericola hypogeus TaxID=300179 RepID=A0ABN2IR28_9MICO